jgi:excinuclease ABC subunit C
MTLEDVKELDIPTRPGSYQYYDASGKIIYVGKAANLKSRVLSYWQKSTTHSPAKAAMMKEIVRIEWIETDSEIEALLLESNLIKKHQPQFNVMLRDDKRYAYVHISLDDEVPGVFIARTIGKSGKYYGPFTSGGAIKETLKTIRKIWPYCTERKIKAKPCFYYHVGRCLGVCGGVVTRKEYMDKVIKPIELFFEGKKSRIITDYGSLIRKLESQIKKAANDADREKLESKLQASRYQLLNMRNVLEHTNILGLLDKYATDVVELAKVLELDKTPQRIEGYDISNNFGEEAVGSMVVFAEGEPDKNEYRKFKIKTGQGLANDTGMLKEVVTRRLNNDWPLPDLMIIDGGKGQVNAVLSILKKNNLDIQVIGISKGEGLRSAMAPDKLFFPGQSKPLVLPLASPALHLIKRVRDEAHRFAIGYHRDLRSKRWFDK